jgi:Tol biopolymer transport system component
VLAAAAVVVSGVCWWYVGRAEVTPPASAVELQIVPPAGRPYWFSAEGVTFAVSPDGRRLAFVTASAGQNQIWLRPLTAIDATPLAGTEDASSVFWSPDGHSIGFFAAGVLKRFDLSSGIAIPICPVRLGAVHTGTWSSTNQILFASVEGESIHAVSEDGGEVTDVLKPDRGNGELRIVFPSFLPDGRRFLYLLRKTDGSSQLMLGEAGKPPRSVMNGDSNTTYVDPGYLVFSRDGKLMARPFALSSGTVTGAERPIADSVRYLLSTGMASFAASLNGTIVYQPHSDRDYLAWFDRSGKELSTVGVAGDYLDVRLERAGKVALFSRSLESNGTFDIWSLDLDRGQDRRLTPDSTASEINPVLSKDGQELFLASTFGGPPQLARMTLTTGQKKPFFPAVPWLAGPCDLSPDGVLVYAQRSERGNFELWAVRVDGTAPPSRMHTSAVTEGGLMFSPDGKFYAYGSYESGRFDAYVESRAGGQKLRVSTGGMVRVRWHPNGREIVYLSVDNRLVTVPVRTAPALELGRDDAVALKGKPWIDFDIAPDGRILAAVRDLSAGEQPLTARLGWRGGK